MLPSKRVFRCVLFADCSRQWTVVTLLFASLAIVALSGCGGGPASTTPPPSQISVSVSPSSASVILGTTKQFMASVSGTSNTAVNWSVNGTLGGNSTSGMIDANGIYTAPGDLPSPASITITAVSQADGTSSKAATVTVTSDISVSAMTNPAFTLGIPTGSNVAVAASIASQGKPDQKVSWSVNSIANGNSTVGTISPTGQNTASYQAPTSVPTPFTVNITATSVADASKSASIPMIVAGTIASTSQNISAATGGTITLPDGSSVIIAPGVLPSDQSLTLSEVSYLANQPPNTAIIGAGAGLVLTFETPVQPSIATLLKTNSARIRANLRANTNTSSAPIAFQFSINTASNNVTLLNGSLPSADFVDAVGTNTFTGVDGNYDSTAKIVTGNIRGDLLAGFVTDMIASIQFSAMNITNRIGFGTIVPGGLSLGLDDKGNPVWGPYVGCPTGRTLVLVHGMLASVEDTFPPDIAHMIQMAGENSNFYDSVVGFDYDWIESITTNGKSLATFLDTLAACPTHSLDVEAHSEGVAVSMAALIQTQPQTNAKIQHFVSIAGPIMGTPAANDPRILQGIVLACHIDVVNSQFTNLLVDLVLQAPFVPDLRTSVSGDGGTLDQIRTTLGPRTQQNLPQVFVIGGTHEVIECPGGGGVINMSWATPLMGTANFDGFIPLASALAFDSGLKVYPGIPVNASHQELVTNPVAMKFVGQQVTETRTPSFLCTASLSCEAPRTSSFQFTGSNFDPAVQNLRILSQDLSGAVTFLPTPGLQDTGGNIDWSAPNCSQQDGPHSIFVFDTILASNNVMQTVDPATCSTGSAGSITTVVGNGVAGYSGDGGPASSAHLFVPSGIAFDPSGNMFIADSSNNIIRRVDAITQVITTIAGTGVPGYSGDNGPAVNARLNDPTHVVFDRSGNLYITDALNERIRKVDTNTHTITTVVGNGVAGFSGDGGPATSAELNFPDGVGLDTSDNVYIGDALNNRVRKLDVTTGIITTVAGTGTGGFSGDGGLATNAELNFPSRPALDAAGNIYIADFQNNRVRRVDATTHVIVTVAGTGTAAYSGDGGQARSADLSGPITVTVDTSGNLYIGDINNARIRLVNTGTGPITVAGVTIQPETIVTIAGNGIVGYQGDGGPAISAELNFPTGLLLNPAGNLYFADAKNNVIRVVSLQ